MVSCVYVSQMSFAQMPLNYFLCARKSAPPDDALVIPANERAFVGEHHLPVGQFFQAVGAPNTPPEGIQGAGDRPVGGEADAFVTTYRTHAV